jgi:hypothetical protein
LEFSNTTPFRELVYVIMPFGPDHVIIGTDIASDPTAAMQFKFNSSPTTVTASFCDGRIVASDAIQSIE